MDDPSTTTVTEGFGLMFYNARWYDPYLNQFTQPDSIVPDQYNSLDWNRYAYTRYNPIKYSDPSGHVCVEGNGSNDEVASSGNCGGYGSQAEYRSALISTIWERYRWTIKGDDWTLQELQTIYQTGRDIEQYADSMTGGNGLDWMQYAFGNTTIEHVDFADGHSDTMPFLGENFGPRIRLNENWLDDPWGASVVFAHELGHVWDINSGFTYSGEMNRNLGGSSWCFFCAPGDGVPQWRPEYHGGYGNSGRNEYFAEAFAATVYSPGIVPAGASEWIRLQMLQDVLRYLFPGGLQ
jgi:RHS repeat-associated protein